MFAFHHITAFEDEIGVIKLYLNSFDNADIVAEISEFSETVPQKLQRMAIDFKTSSIALSIPYLKNLMSYQVLMKLY